MHVVYICSGHIHVTPLLLTNESHYWWIFPWFLRPSPSPSWIDHVEWFWRQTFCSHKPKLRMLWGLLIRLQILQAAYLFQFLVMDDFVLCKISNLKVIVSLFRTLQDVSYYRLYLYCFSSSSLICYSIYLPGVCLNKGKGHVEERARTQRSICSLERKGWDH